MPYTPGYMHNDGCHIISLSKYCAWLGEQAEALGVMVFPGFAGTEVLYEADGDRSSASEPGTKVSTKTATKGPILNPVST